MGLWRNVARLARGIANQGVQDPGPVDLLGPVQVVQLLDDSSRLVPPPDVPEGLVFVSVAAGGAGLCVGLAIEPGGAGLLVRRLIGGDTAGDLQLFQQTTLANFTPTATVTPPWFPNFASRFRSGTFPTANLPAGTSVIGNTGALQSSRAPVELDLFIPPGRILFVLSEDNALLEVSVQVREVPA